MIDPYASRPGDEVMVHDTSNKKDLKAWIRQINYVAKTVEVYVERFKTTMRFDFAGNTPRGRFKLQERV